MSILQIVQLVISGALIIVIMLQSKSAGLSGAFGGNTEVFATKRGPEKVLFIATIVLAIAFIGLSILFIII